MFVHPGCSRIHAHSYLERYNEKIIVWYRHNKFSEFSIYSQEHHYHSMNDDIFKIQSKNSIRANVDEILEMHMQEERNDIVSSVQNIRAMFNFEKPILLGKCEDDVYDYIRPNTTESKGVVIDNLK